MATTEGTAPDNDAAQRIQRTVADYERLRGIVEVAPIGIGIVDLDGHTVLTNDTLRRMLGYSQEEFASVHFNEITHPDDIAANEEAFAKLVRGEVEQFELEKRFIHRDGQIVWGRLIASLLRDEHGNPEHAVGMLEDITETRRLQAELRSAQANFRQLVEQVPAVVYVAPLNLEGPWRYVSPRFAELFSAESGGELRDLRPTYRAAILDEDRIEVESVYLRDVDEQAAAGDTVSLTYRVRRLDGQVVWVRDEFSIVGEPDGELVVRGVLLDITREKELEQELELLAFRDPLTELANLRLFRDRVGQRLERRAGPQAAVLFVDLDDFKDVNDEFGHTVGDELLRAVAARLRACLRPEDTASRIGGDEFAVLLENVDDVDAAAGVAARVLAMLTEPVEFDDVTVTTSASIGVAMLTDVATTDEALRNADLAMYQAKERGKNQLAVFDSDPT